MAFLDGVGIEHDGEGAADDLPDEIDGKKLKKTVDDLLKSFDPEVVKIYLYTFQLQKSEGWDAISELFANDASLQLGVATTPEPAPEPTKEEEAPVAEESAAPVEVEAEADASEEE